MSIAARRLRRREPVELNITAFMNLMVILVPFLLITAVFSRMAILELNLPSSGEQTDAVVQTPQIEVIVRARRIEIGERNGGLLTQLPAGDDGHDFHGLSKYLQRIKAQHPDMTDATILLEPDVPYDLLVQVMDAVRVFDDKEPGARARAELFPEISIGDAPVRRGS